MKKRREKGAALVEFALILPLLMGMLFAIVECGMYFYDVAVLTNASREAARAGVVVYDLPGQPPRRTKAELEEIVNAYLGNSPLLNMSGDVATYTVTTEPDPPENLTRGQILTVTITSPFDFVIIPNFFSQVADTTITTTARMRAE